MHEVKIYGQNGCPHCFFTERKMQNVKDVKLTVIHDIAVVKEFAKSVGKTELPIVVIDGEVCDFLQATKWVEEHS